MGRMKRLGRWAAASMLVVAGWIVISNVWVIESTEEFVFTDARAVPINKVGLVLGTSHRLSGGAPNPFFENRMATAALLYKEGKVSYLLLSGDNRTKYYNEPVEMRKALIKAGVPDSVITLDYAGLRTLDSVVRSKEIFGQDKITIITQPFHSYRALFISRYYRMEAVALVADEPQNPAAAKVYWREYLARAKAVLDLYILKTEPRHLGKHEHIGA
ncbi:MAG: YdcF family protein [Cyclobacteriaceae bacterium]|nr:YdcF family protein [Cyclobacteriaceae bacterium]